MLNLISYLGSNNDVSRRCYDISTETKENSSYVDLGEKEKVKNQAQLLRMEKPMDICRPNQSRLLHSGIDDFVLLRTGVKSPMSANYPPSKSVIRNTTKMISRYF